MKFLFFSHSLHANIQPGTQNHLYVIQTSSLHLTMNNCLLHTASSNNIKKMDVHPYLYNLKNSGICNQQVVPITLCLSGNKEGCTLEYMHIFHKHTVCNSACFKVLTMYLLKTQIGYNTTYTTLQSKIFFSILSLILPKMFQINL
jgi:hypothetical protein